MSWLDYLWGLVPRFLRMVKEKTTSHAYQAMDTLAAIFEKVRTDIYLVRAEYFVGKCSPAGLVIHGNGIRFPKFVNETDEQYRARLGAAYKYFLEGGTVPGLRQAFIDMGYPDIEIVEHYKTAGVSEWALFSVVSTLSDWTASTYERDQMNALINRLKPAHTQGFFRRLGFITDSPDSLVDVDLLDI